MARKRITSEDVANSAGVSRTTVSLVLNNVPDFNIREETRQRVLKAAEELGYVPDAHAQALASRRSSNVGLVLTRQSHHLSSDAFISQILDSLVKKVSDYDMRLLLDIIFENHGTEVYFNLVLSNRVDGIIFSGPHFDEAVLHILADQGFPTVIMGQLPGNNFYCVDVDNRLAAHKAVAHLIGLGHKRIACITNANLTYTASKDRLQGYQDALHEAHISYDERLVRIGDFDLESGYSQMLSLLKNSPLPSAVFVASDVVAFGAMAAIRELNLSIPQDIAVVGFDDVPLANFADPHLTTVHVPASELAERSLEVLIELIKGTPPKEHLILLDTHLVIRESCGANIVRADHNRS